MNKGLFAKLLPHLLAVVIFLAVALIYCKPALEGKVVNQSDVTQWQGSIHQSEIYKDAHGNYPLWTNSLFSGMPTFQIGGLGGNYAGYWLHNILTLGLPKPISFFFLACICFYFLSQILRVRSYISILGALTFAYATYDSVIISVGHDTKMFSIAYMPAVIGCFILIFEKKFWVGAMLAALFTSAMIAANHLQIVYYTFIIIGIMTVFYAVRWIREKQIKTFALAALFAGVAFLVGVFTNSIVLFSTYEYQKETIRGGPSDLSGSVKKEDAANGLTKDYAFSYSMEKAEPFVMLVPHMYGGSGQPIESLVEESKAVQSLQAMPKELANQIGGARSAYWGGLAETGIGTSGPPYSGAIVCFLAMLAFFVLDSRHKWWALSAIVFAIVMSWGSFFEGFNSLLYNYLPFYNKFRAPSMALVIPQVLLPMLAVLAVDKISTAENRKAFLPAFKKSLLATAFLFAVLFVLYMSLDFLSKSDHDTLNRVREMNQPQLMETISQFFNSLKADRKGLMLGDIFRSLGFIALAAAFVFLLLRNILKPVVAVVLLTVFAFTDVMAISVKYLNTENYREQEENTLAFQKTKWDEELLADKSFYRVFNVNGNAFNENMTSYYYNSIGGYHPAKLRIYQDLIEHQLAKETMNQGVLDMLNTKYLIQKDQNGQTQSYQQRPTILGPAWFVKTIRYVKNADEEMAALNNFSPKDTAIVQESFHSNITPFTSSDSTGNIQLIKNDNDVVNYKYQCGTNRFAVFSEVYYDKGWKAFIDGKEQPIVKTNYVLRGLSLPSGSHTIEFRFEPHGYYLGKTILTIASLILLLLIAGAVYFEWKKKKPVAV